SRGWASHLRVPKWHIDEVARGCAILAACVSSVERFSPPGGARLGLRPRYSRSGVRTDTTSRLWAIERPGSMAYSGRHHHSTNLDRNSPAFARRAVLRP